MLTRGNRSATGTTAAIIISLAAFLAQVEDLPADQTKKMTKIECNERIVAIGGDVTEIVFALGAGNCVIAIDSTSQFPIAALKEKKNVGYMRALSAEGVLSTGGTLILASEGAGPAEAVRALKASSVKYVSVPDRPTEHGVLEKIKILSNAVGQSQNGTVLARQTRSAFADLNKRRSKLGPRINALFVLATHGSRIIVGGKGTSAHSVLELAGVSNAAADLTGFKPITVEALISMAPEAIIVMQRQTGAHSAEALLKLAAVKQTPAGKSDRIFEMNGSYLLGFGPRTPTAAKELMSKLYTQSARTK